MAIRWKLRSLMADRKMKVNQLAELMGVHRVTVSAWKNSDQIPPFADPNQALNELCFHLRCNPADLIEYVPDD